MIITAPEKLRLVFLGDSITVGDGDSKAKGWPARLCAMTSSQPTLTQCYNLGIGGDRIEGLAHRVQSELAVRLAGRTGRGAAIMIGVNDAIRAAATTEQIPLDFDALATNFRHTLREAKNYGPVLIIEPTPVSMTLVRDDGGTGSKVMANLLKINQLLGLVAASEDVPVLPLTQTLQQDAHFMEALALGDSLHPSATGYDIIAYHISRSPLWSAFLMGVLRDI